MTSLLLSSIGMDQSVSARDGCCVALRPAMSCFRQLSCTKASIRVMKDTNQLKKKNVHITENKNVSVVWAGVSEVSAVGTPE